MANTDMYWSLLKLANTFGKLKAKKYLVIEGASIKGLPVLSYGTNLNVFTEPESFIRYFQPFCIELKPEAAAKVHKL